jgi:hypothetical protein
MPNQLSRFINAVLGRTDASAQIVASSSGWFVANTDTKTAESDPDDPSSYALAYVDASQTKVPIVETTGKSYIDAVHFYVGSDPAADVKVRAFGFWPRAEGAEAREPYQISTSYPQTTATHIRGGFWGPLFKPEPGGTHEQSLTSGAPEVVADDASPNYKVRGGVSWATNGCTHAVILVSTASTTPTVGLVLARTGN